MIHELDQGQKHFPGNPDIHLIQEALATRRHFAVDLFVVRNAQLEEIGHPFQSQSWIWIDFSRFSRGSLSCLLYYTLLGIQSGALSVQ